MYIYYHKSHNLAMLRTFNKKLSKNRHQSLSEFVLNFPGLEWPGNSPNFNPFENLWAIVKATEIEIL